ncbi:MAG: hypothetical protein ABI364_09100 [Caldimonas sp.]
MNGQEATASGLTGWLGTDQSPARAGVYARRSPAGPYACWDGARWRADAATVEAAARQGAASLHRRAAWRGLAQATPGECSTCRGHTVIDRGVDSETGADLIAECPDC